MKHEEIELEYALSTYLYNSTRNRIINLVAHKQVSAKYTESFKIYNEEPEHNTTDHLLRHNELSASDRPGDRLIALKNAAGF